jgi:D-arginine dehydrogenase
VTTATGCDVIVIGAGIAGASLAFRLAAGARTVVLERESQPGYHATGRSAAQYIASYGTPQVRALTRASRTFLEQPPAGFADAPVLQRRGALTVAFEGQQALLDEAWRLLCTVTDRGERLDADAACASVPVLRRERVVGAVHEPESFDIDVHALHQGFLRGLKRAGGQLVCDAEVTAIERLGPRWRVCAGAGVWQAPVLVNAAGAWCDVIARRAGVAPIGLVPKRRSAFTFRPPAGLEVGRWPLVIAADHGFYFKPDAGVLLGSPANADDTEPQDVRPEELDIALGAHRIEQHTTMPVRPESTWAGLRSFVADGDLVGGYDDDAAGFFWCAAQGGYGIQTAAAMGEACAALVRGQALPRHLSDLGLSPAMLSPSRLRRR